MDAKASLPLKARRILFWIFLGIFIALVWTGGLLIQMKTRGETFAHAAPIMLVLTVGGIIDGAIYRRVSRQRDLVGTFSFMLVVQGWPYHPNRHDILLSADLRTCLDNVVYWALAACVIGLISRRFSKDKRKPAHSPLWDSEIDR